MYSSLNQVVNPTDEQRHEMLRISLENTGRLEDYDFIIRLLSPPPDITKLILPGELRGVKIGIIGGGLAGLSAAYELRKSGADITIFEASDERIGGRVYTCYFDSNKKYFGEFGAMRIPATHETTWHYINLFGLNTLPLTPLIRNNILYVHNTRLRTTESIKDILYPKYSLTLQEQNTPWAELNQYAFTYRYLQLTPKVRSELINILPRYSTDFIPLMNMSLRDNFESLGLSQGAINLISGVDPTSGALLHISYDEIAHEDYTFDNRNTYRIQGGNVNLPLSFYHSFHLSNPPGYKDIPQISLGDVSYKAGHCVTGIYQSDYRNKVVIKYTNKTESSDATDIFDYIICTIPFSTLRTVEIKPYFSNMKMQAILELGYVDAMKSLIFCNRRFWERNTDYGNIIGGASFTDLPIQSIIYPPDHNLCSEGTLCSSEEPGVLTAYNLGQNATRVGEIEEPRRYELIRQNIEEVHGLPRGFLNLFVENYQTVQWNSESNLRSAFALTLPSQKRLFAYEMLQPEFNNRVYFAGEHVSTKHGWMQGALYTGKEAANRIAEHFHYYEVH